MKTRLKIRINITNDAPIQLELEPAGNGEARVYLHQSGELQGYATVFLNDLLIAVRALLMLEKTSHDASEH